MVRKSRDGKENGRRCYGRNGGTEDCNRQLKDPVGNIDSKRPIRRSGMEGKNLWKIMWTKFFALLTDSKFGVNSNCLKKLLIYYAGIQ